MKDFRQHFLFESVKKLQSLIADLKNKESLSDSDKSVVFRTLHTIKGTSQTFGFNISSRIAHELENLLSAKNQEISNQILIEGLEFLKESFEKTDFVFPEKFIETCRKISPSENKKLNLKTNSAKLPPEIFLLLSSQEKISLGSELEKGKILFCVEAGFEFSNFSAGLKSFREIISEQGEIIATFPSQKFSLQGKIGFQILFVSFKKTEKIREIIEKFTAEIIFDSLPETFSFDLQGVMAQVVSHGKNVAENLNKNIEIEVSAEKIAVSEKNLKLIFDSLLHLVRNAVDHAFEMSGKVKISLESSASGLFIKFSDDGRGIDLDKIRAKIGKENLSDKATLELIFQSEFSTAEKITEISGRGVGLEAVKNAVENVGGKITVKSRLNEGTIFEIYLPK